MVFFGCFLDAPPTSPFIDTHIFGIWKVLRWYISGPSFIYVWLVVPKFSNFKCFHSNKKFDFTLFLGSFLNVTPWNKFRYIWNCDHWCNAKKCIRYLIVFIQFLRNGQNWAKKVILCSFLEVFCFRPLRLYELRSNLLPN